MRLAASVARPNLISMGICFGKFSKSGKFRLHITALDYLAQYAKYKVLFESIYQSEISGLDFKLIHPDRCGLSQTVKCRFYTAITSSKPIWGELRKTPQSTRAWSSTA
jgi:hypothetical protein